MYTIKPRGLAAAILLAACLPICADEGMWTCDNPLRLSELQG